MPLRNARPLAWRPSGLSDSIDGTNSFVGAMQSLSNLIPDPSTRAIWRCRPAAINLTNFQPFTLPGQVSVLFTVGDILYGLVASQRFPGFDEPFSFNLLTKAFVTVSGVTANNVPATQPSTGDWTPPTIAPLSVYLMVTHPGFTGNLNGYLGWFNVSDPNFPSWNSGNLTGNPLFFVPRAVSVYGGRAYYAVGNATVASDAENPLNVTNANQVLTFGSNTPITALAGMPLNNQLGGIIASLMVFKESEEGSTIYQVTGDYSGIPSAWAINQLNVSGGTEAPNTICATPYGLAFIDHDGLRILTLTGTLSDPIGANGDGVTVPFQNAVSPTRMTAAFNRNIYRVTVQNGLVAGNPLQEYWYDFVLKKWSGPHTFPIAQIETWRNSFVVANTITPSFPNSGIWRSDARPSPISTYIENGAPIDFTWQTVLLPDNQQMRANLINEMNIAMAFIGSQTMPLVSARDSNGNYLGQVTIDPTRTSPSLWGNFDWGNANWGGNGVETTDWNGPGGTQSDFLWDGNNWDGDVSQLSPWRIAWPEQLIFKQMTVTVSGTSSAGFRIGNLYMEYQVLGYQQQIGSGIN